jgi:hypothetical protein
MWPARDVVRTERVRGGKRLGGIVVTVPQVRSIIYALHR